MEGLGDNIASTTSNKPINCCTVKKLKVKNRHIRLCRPIL